MSTFDPDSFLSTPLTRVMEALADVSKLDLLAEIEKLQTAKNNLETRLERLMQESSSGNKKWKEVQEALNKQIEETNKRDKSLNFERIRRVLAESLLSKLLAAPNSYISSHDKDIKGWILARDEQVRQQELSK